MDVTRNPNVVLAGALFCFLKMALCVVLAELTGYVAACSAVAFFCGAAGGYLLAEWRKLA